MSSEESGTRWPGEKTATVRPGQVVRSRDALGSSHEMRREGDDLILTIFCPEIPPRDLRVAVRGRHVLVWGRNAPRSWQHLVMLPQPVAKEACTHTFRNGVFELRARLGGDRA